MKYKAKVKSFKELMAMAEDCTNGNADRLMIFYKSCNQSVTDCYCREKTEFEEKFERSVEE